MHKGEINKQIQNFLDNDIIKLSDSLYSFFWTILNKPDVKINKRRHMVINYKASNEKISKAYPLSNITEIFNQLGSTKYF